ncbi:Conserved oligomeric Golgi complex subunit 2 [Phytophthora pseudosyringae]|uniref:Conserved oligomeric Golgi complex subunit 2 n=1 Tax=Phytophthora pseudosyringae TaxID=221518 RepID=A0A8T1WAK7_9STRA|nr:Conserved oligomeric Golgi complex subunit 2 [Phytophthora pseudosyringae]
MVLGTYCFDEEAFSGEAFEVAAFLEDCRARSPMETIHQDLKQFQTALENQLVAIINEDYAEFLQLSSKLKGVDEAVSSVRAPILAVLKRVDEVQHAMSALQSKIQTQVQTAEELQQQERDLQLSIRISEKLLLLEDLLEVESPVDSSECDEELELSLGKGGPIDSDEDSDDEFENFDRVKQGLNAMTAAEGCAKLERAAQIFVQLDLEFMNGMHLGTIQREEKRLAVIEETLLHRLETEFATEIFPDTFYNRDHTISSLTLSYLLRAYVLLHKSYIPEEMIGRLLVQPFAEENLTRGKLDGRVRGSCEGLPQIYESIMDFISSKFAGTLAQSVCQGESKCSVDILGNAIWKPMQEILASKHGVVFQAANPERFHQSYTISMRFLSDIEERFCKTEIMKIRFRSHESVVEFKEKWNIDVYFQLRASQLASSLEKSFGVKRDESAASDTLNGSTVTAVEKSALVFENSKRLWQAMQECWNEHIFLAPLLPNFCKLCVQLFAYYIDIWKEPLLNTVAVLNSGTKVDFAAVPLYFLSTGEDLLLAGSDFHVLYKKISQDLLTIVKTHVGAFTDDSQAFVTELFQEPLASLAEIESSCWSTAVTMVSADCKKVLPAIRTVKGQYQMTNKPPPTTPSTYVPNIIRPMQSFFEKWGVHFDAAKKQQLLQAIVEDICEVYSNLSSDLLRSALELEESLKSRKLQRHSGSSSTLASNAVSDTEKMRMQLLLDLEEIQREVAALGLDVQHCNGLQAAIAKLSESDNNNLWWHLSVTVCAAMVGGGHWSASLWRWGLCVTMASLSLWKVLELAVSGDASLDRIFGKKSKKEKYQAGFPGLVGNTPLVELASLSEATGCRILAKAEFLNPGGSSKDRVAKGIVEDAERRGLLKDGGTIVEGTSGSTGISLSLMARARGYRCIIVMPDDQAKEKSQLLEQFGAEVVLVKPASIVNAKHYVNEAKRLARSTEGGYFTNQFENTANFDSHYASTGPEIWRQTNGTVDAFIMAAGTGGTIAGASAYLKEQNPDVQVFLADPPGSSLYNKVRSNVCYAPQQAETKVRRHRYDTIAEGVGIDRLTENFVLAKIDDAFKVTDQEIVEMSRFLLREEGLFVGSSSGLNCVAAVRAARKLGPGHTIVTVLCDSGQRHLTKFWNEQHIREDWLLEPKAAHLEFLDGSTGQP